MADPNNNSHIEPQVSLDPEDGIPYINELEKKLNDLLSQAQTIKDVEDRMGELYPQSKLVNNAIKEAHKSKSDTQKTLKIRHHSTSSSASITGTLHNITSFAIAKFSSFVRDGNENDHETKRFKMALIEYILNDVLYLAEDFVARHRGNYLITRSDIRTAMHADKDLLDMFLSEDKSLSIMDNHPILAQIAKVTTSRLNYEQLQRQTYSEKVKSMRDSEQSFIRGLKMIINVFKAQLSKLPHIKSEVDTLFCNIEDLYEFSTQLLIIYEEALELAGQEKEDPYIGCEIFDLAQAEEFQAFFNFAYRRLSHSEHWRAAYNKIVTNEFTMTSIRTAGQSFDLAVKHLLPNYLLNTIVRFFEHYKNINELLEISKRSKNPDDRLALKETISILIKTKKAIEDLLENELDSRDKEIESLQPKQAEDIRQILERRLDAEIKHEDNMRLPFMPPPDIYRFSEPDSIENIQFDEPPNSRTNSGPDADIKQVRDEIEQIPVIRCATLIKLVERLTYHCLYPNILDTFLTTYRSFVSDPEELLDLLIERFKIPDPPISVVFPNFSGLPEDLPETEKTTYRQYLRQFRQKYSKPVKMRVINVIKSWVKNHFYDFERHSTLLNKLHLFLDEVKTSERILHSLIISIERTIEKTIEQKKISSKGDYEYGVPPPILRGTAQPHEIEKFDILTLHPKEFARQLTLIEFNLFRAIKPSELINAQDLREKTSKDSTTSPNLRRMERHFDLVSYWVRKRILEEEELQRRSDVYNRAVEILCALEELNNYTGFLIFGSALRSSPITRLHNPNIPYPILLVLSSSSKKILEHYDDLYKDHCKGLQNAIRRCNPPCIPFLGLYQNKLIHAKEGNKTYLYQVNTTSPTLSNEEGRSSFSNSPATPISPRTPAPRITNPPSATPTTQNQFFPNNTLTRPRPINLSNITSNFNAALDFNLGNNNMGGDFESISTSPSGVQMHMAQQQAPPTPAPRKMINFTKQRIRAGLVAEISNYQNLPYCFTVQPDIKQFIEDIESRMVSFAVDVLGTPQDSNGVSIANDVIAMTKRFDDYLYKQSEKIFPRPQQQPANQSSRSKGWKSPGTKS